MIKSPEMEPAGRTRSAEETSAVGTPGSAARCQSGLGGGDRPAPAEAAT